MLKARILTEEDYDELCIWWKQNRFPIPPRELLPENGTCGIMVHKEGINICAGFMYFTNSKICWQEYIVADFNYRESDRIEAIEYLIETLTSVAKDKGYKVIFSSVKNPNLIKRFENCGYLKGNSDTTEMIIKL